MDANKSEIPKLPLQILQALERKPMTIENLAYGFEIPVEEMRVIAEKLLHDEVIDTTLNNSNSSRLNLVGATGAGLAIAVFFPPAVAVASIAAIVIGGTNIVSSVFRHLSDKKQIKIHNTSTYFTITPKGHFHLHPVTASEGTK